MSSLTAHSPNIGRRFALVMSVGACGLLGVAAPSAGASPSRPHHPVTRTAIAAWQLSSPTSANVSLQVSEVGKSHSTTLSFHVSEQYCDVTHNRDVFRGFDGVLSRTPLFSVAPGLASASLQANLTITGSEQVFQGCFSRSGEPVTRSFRPFDVHLAVAWLATGRASIIQPGIAGRPASAAGLETSKGHLDLGDLGLTSFAQLRFERS